MRIEEIEKKEAEIEKQKAEIELAKKQIRESEREKTLMDNKRAEAKRKTQIDHDNYVRQKQLEQNMVNQQKSDLGRTMKAQAEARKNKQGDIDMGYTKEEIRFKYLDKNARIREMNKEAVKKTEASLKGANSFLSDIY